MDNVNHPEHYSQEGHECFDVMQATQPQAYMEGFCICNAFKYLYRHANKGQLEDIKKAKWYIDKYIDIVESWNHTGKAGENDR